MNTEPDEYNCVCPQGYSGKTCQIGEGGGGSLGPARLFEEDSCSNLKVAGKLMSE